MSRKQKQYNVSLAPRGTSKTMFLRWVALTKEFYYLKGKLSVARNAGDNWAINLQKHFSTTCRKNKYFFLQEVA